MVTLLGTPFLFPY